MPTRYYESGVLFNVAVQSAASIQAPLRKGGQLPALVSLVFSVVAIEAFLNEAAEMATGFLDIPSEPQGVALFVECMADAERSSLESKLALANWTLAGKKLDRGTQPYQDFALLVRLRNDLVHFKANEAYGQSATPEEFHKALIQRFGSRNLLADDMELGSWTYAIETKAVANWCCKTAACVVVDFVSKVPQGAYRTFVEGIKRHFQPYAYVITNTSICKEVKSVATEQNWTDGVQQLVLSRAQFQFNKRMTKLREPGRPTFVTRGAFRAAKSKQKSLTRHLKRRTDCAKSFRLDGGRSAARVIAFPTQASQ
jgi:hypothetical protein